jgi:hypothetical protein
VDAQTLTHPEWPILAINLDQDEDQSSLGSTFRVIPSEMASLTANLGLANMDWEDFAGSGDDNGMYRG